MSIQDLSLKLTFELSSFNISNYFSNLSRIRQENFQVLGTQTYTIGAIQKVCFIKSSNNAVIKITTTNNVVQTLPITETLLLTGTYSNIAVENTSLDVTNALDVFFVGS
jgi:NADH:ubiquinone oxidoreductase subunit 4 (subunit M)